MTRAALLALLFATGCARDTERVLVDGSSTLYPLAEAMVSRLHARDPQAEIVASVSGSAAGIARLCRQEIDVALSSRVLSAAERAHCDERGVLPLWIPVAKDAIAIVVHADNAFVSTLTLQELRHLWHPDAEDRVVTWRNVRSDFPTAPLQLYGAGAFSGTFEQFTRAVVGQERKSRADFIASEDDSVLVHGVMNDRRALGYFSLGQHKEGKTKLVAVDFGQGPVLPSQASVDDGRYAPLARTLSLYVTRERLRAKPVRAFVRSVVEASADDIARAGLLRLDDATRADTANLVEEPR